MERGDWRLYLTTETEDQEVMHDLTFAQARAVAARTSRATGRSYVLVSDDQERPQVLVGPHNAVTLLAVSALDDLRAS